MPLETELYAPPAADIVITDVALPPDDNITDEGPRDAAGPEDEYELLKVTVPEKPLVLVSVMVVVPVEACPMFKEDGLAPMVKSGVAGPVRVTMTVLVCVEDPLVPVIVTV